MVNRSILSISLFGFIVGLGTGLFDALFHTLDLNHYKLLNFLIFIFFLSGVYLATIKIREDSYNGIINYWGSLINYLLIGLVASVTIAFVRYIYLKLINITDITQLVSNTKDSILNYYGIDNQEFINNRLEFIEFIYDPFISSLFYFLYYMVFVIVFAVISSFFIRKQLPSNAY